MLSRYIWLIGLDILIATHIAQSIVLLTANVGDVERIARKIFSEPIAEQIVNLISHSAGNVVSNVSEENEEKDAEIKKEIKSKQKKFHGYYHNLIARQPSKETSESDSSSLSSDEGRIHKSVEHFRGTKIQIEALEHAASEPTKTLKQQKKKTRKPKKTKHKVFREMKEDRLMTTVSNEISAINSQRFTDATAQTKPVESQLIKELQQHREMFDMHLNQLVSEAGFFLSQAITTTDSSSYTQANAPITEKYNKKKDSDETISNSIDQEKVKPEKSSEKQNQHHLLRHKQEKLRLGKESSEKKFKNKHEKTRPAKQSSERQKAHKQEKVRPEKQLAEKPNMLLSGHRKEKVRQEKQSSEKQNQYGTGYKPEGLEHGMYQIRDSIEVVIKKHKDAYNGRGKDKRQDTTGENDGTSSRYVTSRSKRPMVAYVREKLGQQNKNIEVDIANYRANTGMVNEESTIRQQANDIGGPEKQDNQNQFRAERVVEQSNLHDGDIDAQDEKQTTRQQSNDLGGVVKQDSQNQFRAEKVVTQSNLHDDNKDARYVSNTFYTSPESKLKPKYASIRFFQAAETSTDLMPPIEFDEIRDHRDKEYSRTEDRNGKRLNTDARSLEDTWKTKKYEYITKGGGDKRKGSRVTEEYTLTTRAVKFKEIPINHEDKLTTNDEQMLESITNDHEPEHTEVEISHNEEEHATVKEKENTRNKINTLVKTTKLPTKKGKPI